MDKHFNWKSTLVILNAVISLNINWINENVY